MSHGLHSWASHRNKPSLTTHQILWINNAPDKPNFLLKISVQIRTQLSGRFTCRVWLSRLRLETSHDSAILSGCWFNSCRPGGQLYPKLPDRSSQSFWQKNCHFCMKFSPKELPDRQQKLPQILYTHVRNSNGREWHLCPPGGLGMKPVVCRSWRECHVVSSWRLFLCQVGVGSGISSIKNIFTAEGVDFPAWFEHVMNMCSGCLKTYTIRRKVQKRISPQWKINCKRWISG